MTTAGSLVPYVVAGGLATGSGSSLAANRTALAARETLFTRTSAFVGDDYRPLLCALRDPSVPDALEDRLEVLAAEALADLSAHSEPWDADPMPLLLCLPEVHPAEGTDVLTSQVVSRLLGRIVDCGAAIGLRLVPHAVPFFGPTGPAEALAGGSPSAAGGEAVLVATDSYGCRRRLSRLLDEGRLFSDRNPWGLIPGEAGAVFHVRWDASLSGELGYPILGTSIGVEEDGEMDGRDSTFQAMSDCLIEAATALGTPARGLSTGWNNSRYRAAEFAYALRRLPPELLDPDAAPFHPALQVGDVGAAAMMVATMMAADGGRGPTLHCAGAPWRKTRAAWAMVH